MHEDFTSDHMKEFSSREIKSMEFTGVITPREMSVNHHYGTRRDRMRCFYDSMLSLSLDSIAQKLKLDLNFVTSKIFTKINLKKI